jgi:hypothetical protein
VIRVVARRPWCAQPGHRTACQPLNAAMPHTMVGAGHSNSSAPPNLAGGALCTTCRYKVGRGRGRTADLPLFRSHIHTVLGASVEVTGWSTCARVRLWEGTLSSTLSSGRMRVRYRLDWSRESRGLGCGPLPSTGQTCAAAIAALVVDRILISSILVEVIKPSPH